MLHTSFRSFSDILGSTRSIRSPRRSRTHGRTR